MAIANIQEYLQLIPAVNRAPQYAVWLTYDAEPTLYMSITRSQVMLTDSEMADEDVLVRYEGGEVIALPCCMLASASRSRPSLCWHKISSGFQRSPKCSSYWSTSEHHKETIVCYKKREPRWTRRFEISWRGRELSWPMNARCWLMSELH